MTPRICAATVSLWGAVLGCSASPEPTGSLFSIVPNVAYSDAPTPVQIGGEKLRPVYSFDTMAGSTTTEAGDYAVTLRPVAGDAPTMRASVPLGDVKWTSTKGLEATVPAKVDPGTYDVVVTDPRGQETTMPQAFTSLGPDEQAPALTIISPRPDEIVGGQTTITIVVSADDGHGFVASMTVTARTAVKSLTQECGGTPSPMKVCVFDFGAPMPADGNDAVTIEASAIDNRGNDIAISPPAVFPLVTRPYVSSMTPGIGPTGGGTEILVKGTDFVLPYGPSKGTELVINGVPLRDVTVTSTEIRGVTERHDPGLAIVRVRNGVAYSTDWPFEFVAAPGVLRIFPPRGPVSGGTWIAVIGSHFRDGETNIVIGDKQLEEICFVSENRVEGRVPGGDAIGGVAVSADDPIGGAGTMFGTFIYDPAESTETDPPEGGLEPMLCPGAQ